jgi:hypothetical protein
VHVKAAPASPESIDAVESIAAAQAFFSRETGLPLVPLAALLSRASIYPVDGRPGSGILGVRAGGPPLIEAVSPEVIRASFE